MKFTVTMILLLLLAFSATAQVTQVWDTEVDDPYGLEQYSGVCPDGEGGMMAVGRQWNPDTGYYEGVYARFNAQGELLWRNVDESIPTMGRYFTDIAKSPIYQDLFFAVGTWKFGDEYTFYIAEISPEGSIGFAISYSFNTGGILNSIDASYGPMIVAGTTNDDGNGQQGILLSFYQADVITWWETYGTYDDNFLEDVTFTGASYVATGYGHNGTEPHLWVMRTNTNGFLQWSHYQPNYDSTVGRSVTSAYNTDLLVAGYQYDTTSKFFVTRLDIDGNELWSETYSGNGASDNAWWIGPSSQGGYHVAGTGLNSNTQQRDVRVIRIQEDGTLLNDQYFENPDYQYLTGGEGLNDTDFVLTGYQTENLVQEHRSLITRFNPQQDLEVFIDPLDPPVAIPFFGDTFGYEATGVNNTGSNQQVDAWMQVEHIASELTVQTRLFENVNLPANSELSATLYQSIPQAAPEGDYRMRIFIGDFPWVQQAGDWFSFTKLGPTFTVAADFRDVFEDPSLWTASGNFGTADEVVSTDDALPAEFILSSAFPNPFNPATTLSVSLPETVNLRMVVMNTLGQRVAELANGQFSAGTHSFTVDGSNLASGIYFVHASVPGKLNSVQKIVLMK